MVAALGVAACGAGGPPADAGPPPSREQIWTAILPQADRYRIDPGFVFALVAAESNFDPRAQNGQARGLMQIKPAAWADVSNTPYETGVWDWRTNLEVGIDYLAYCRAELHRKSNFTYPLLLASFHYGFDFVERRRFDIGRIPIPENDIYRRLWRGDLTPVAPPGSAKPLETDSQ